MTPNKQTKEQKCSRNDRPTLDRRWGKKEGVTSNIWGTETGKG